MPVRAAIDEIKPPKTVLRHRPIATKTTKQGKDTQPPVIVQRASRPTIDAGEEQVVQEWKRLTGQLARGKQQHTIIPTDKTIPRRPRPGVQCKTRGKVFQHHPLFLLGLGMIVMIVLWMGLNALLNWVTTAENDLRYGRPRTFQTDAWVGNESTGRASHFITINLDRRIEIIELIGGDPARTRLYSGPQLYEDGADLAPVTLSFIDLNGDKKPDMIVHFQQSWTVFLNDGQGGFRPPQPAELSQFSQTLSQQEHNVP